MFFRKKAFSSENFKNAIYTYVEKGIFSEEYPAVEKLKNDLHLLGDEHYIDNFSYSVRIEHFPLNDLYCLGYACEKLSKDFFTSSIVGGVMGGASYFSGTSFLLMSLLGSSSFLFTTSFLFFYRIHQKSVEGYEKIYRFEEIFNKDSPIKEKRICPRLSPFSGR
jgi:hypothetical protein